MVPLHPAVPAEMNRPTNLLTDRPIIEDEEGSKYVAVALQLILLDQFNYTV